MVYCFVVLVDLVLMLRCLFVSFGLIVCFGLFGFALGFV